MKVGLSFRFSRRRFVLGACGALVVETVHADRSKSIYRVTMLFDLEGDHDRRLWLEQFARHGYVVRQNLSATFEYWGSDRSTLEVRARAIVESVPDVICSYRTAPSLLLGSLTREIPIVFFGTADPDRVGLVDSLRAPGRNLTGVSNRFIETVGKRLELLKELRPGSRAVVLLFTAGSVWRTPLLEATSSFARQLNLAIHEIHAPERLSTEDLIQALRQTHADAFVSVDWGVPPDLLVRIQVAARMPGLFLDEDVVRAGGLLSVGPDRADEARRTVAIAARILRGAKPSQIPVDQLTNVRIAVNLKTADAMGLNVPASILLRASEVVR